jgi:catechol 2,3-dioxygenase-like lactoylglutathione lyase family enzyme
MNSKPLRGINHVGVTVPDIEAATTFLIDGVGAHVIYESYSADQPSAGGPELDQALNLAPGTRLVAARMIQVGTGPEIELFELKADAQREAARPSDFGLQHLALYVDDIEAAIARFEAAGGKMFSRPNEILFPKEQGEGNLYCYGQTPWGMMIEFITFPSAMPYEGETPLRRWHANS